MVPSNLPYAVWRHRTDLIHNALVASTLVVQMIGSSVGPCLLGLLPRKRNPWNTPRMFHKVALLDWLDAAADLRRSDERRRKVLCPTTSPSFLLVNYFPIPW